MPRKQKTHRISPKMTLRARRLRRDSTLPERLLWSKLRNRSTPQAKFRRQHPIGRFVVDFCCPEHRLVIELDGHSHDTTAQADEEREEHIRAMGFTVVRFSNEEVIHDLARVLEAIENAVETLRDARAP